AVGLSALLGFKIRHNFFRPYLSVSLSEFWRRWHITLASWIRRHVYIPMGGSRRGKWTQGRNLIFCMVLIGIWHGTGLHFFAWGLLHGIFLFIEKAFLLDLYENFERKIKFSGKISGWIVTQMFVTLTWAIFFIK
ncbi:MAG: MBOAT family protein, partial [Spirochaetia bacterium]|nr:MBOAT family protein [Spirochaetia bacterium]